MYMRHSCSTDTAMMQGRATYGIWSFKLALLDTMRYMFMHIPRILMTCPGPSRRSRDLQQKATNKTLWAWGAAEQH
jgi:hypothetical protein